MQISLSITPKLTNFAYCNYMVARLMKLLRYIILSILLSSSVFEADALSLSLDSIAAMGKLPRFVVNTYRWGDKFFNGYDTTFVQTTGYKFNAKVTTDSWVDGYSFLLPDNKSIHMNSDASSSVGLYLTYLALSVGYDVNLSQILTGAERARKRWRFGFNCMLFAAEIYVVQNDVGTTLKRFGDAHHLDFPFNGINNYTWGIDAYYFFSHKRYSEAASFGFSRIQKRSSGSLFAGLSIYTQKLDFNFNELPIILRDQLPDHWINNHYNVNTHNYAVRAGYGYNWVFAPKWVFGISESPVIGIRKGFVNSNIEKISLSLYNRLKFSVAWNCGRYFFGATGKFDLAIVNNKRTTYAGGVLSAEAVFGIRFNLW